jgi:uncharacterized protein (TIGR02118 family)
MIHVHRFLTIENSEKSALASKGRRLAKEIFDQTGAGISRFARNERIEFPGAVSPYQASEDFYVQNLDELHRVRASDHYQECEKSHSKVFDPIKQEWMVTFDRVMREGKVTPGQVKVIFQLKRRRDMSVKQFREYWGGLHGALGLNLPGIRRYVQSMVIDEAYEYCEPTYDGIAQEWFDSTDAVLAAFQSVEGKTSSGDGPNFLDMTVRRIFVAKEHLLQGA